MIVVVGLDCEVVIEYVKLVIFDIVLGDMVFNVNNVNFEFWIVG